jgi:hypothetical protein
LLLRTVCHRLRARQHDNTKVINENSYIPVAIN